MGLAIISGKYPREKPRACTGSFFREYICQVPIYSPQIARFLVATWGPPGADRTQVGPMLATWTLLCGSFSISIDIALGQGRILDTYLNICAWITKDNIILGERHAPVSCHNCSVLYEWVIWWSIPSNDLLYTNRVFLFEVYNNTRPIRG